MIKNVSILKADINDFRKNFTLGAKKYKDVAENMVFEQGLRGNVTDQFIRKIMPDNFDKSGKLTQTGKENIKSAINLMFNGKRKDCTIQEFFKELFAPQTDKITFKK